MSRFDSSDVEIDVFIQFLVFLYTGNAPRLSEKTTWLLFELADKYFVSRLKEECVHMLEQHIQLENVIDILV